MAHFLVYSTLTALLWIATAGRIPLAVVAAVVIVGGLDELHQAGLPGRVADPADFLVDACAGTCTSALMLLPDTKDRPVGGDGQGRPEDGSYPGNPDGTAEKP